MSHPTCWLACPSIKMPMKVKRIKQIRRSIAASLTQPVPILRNFQNLLRMQPPLALSRTPSMTSKLSEALESGTTISLRWRTWSTLRVVRKATAWLQQTTSPAMEPSLCSSRGGVSPRTLWQTTFVQPLAAWSSAQFSEVSLTSSNNINAFKINTSSHKTKRTPIL